MPYPKFRCPQQNLSAQMTQTFLIRTGTGTNPRSRHVWETTPFTPSTYPLSASKYLPLIFAPCGRPGQSNPLFHTPPHYLFTQRGSFTQPFSTLLWETWETRGKPRTPGPLFPKLQNCTAIIWKTAHHSNSSASNHIGSFPTFPRRTTGTTIFSFNLLSFSHYPPRPPTARPKPSTQILLHTSFKTPPAAPTALNPRIPDNYPTFPRAGIRQDEYNQEEEKTATSTGQQSVVECGQCGKVASRAKENLCRSLKPKSRRRPHRGQRWK